MSSSSLHYQRLLGRLLAHLTSERVFFVDLINVELQVLLGFSNPKFCLFCTKLRRGWQEYRFVGSGCWSGYFGGRTELLLFSDVSVRAMGRRRSDKGCVRLAGDVEESRVEDYFLALDVLDAVGHHVLALLIARRLLRREVRLDQLDLHLPALELQVKIAFWRHLMS